MSYPQPNPDQYALNGYKFFRLNTPLTSDGDMYESQQGAMGFAIGPESDISKVNIGYYDEQVPGFLNQFAITPERSFPGFIAARNDAGYAPSSRPGRTLIWADELYNPTWNPSFVDVAGRTDFEVPVMDVVQYFAPSGLAMNQGRNDKEYWYDFIEAPAADPGVVNAWTVVIPWYGRRYFDVTWQNNQAIDVTMQVLGLHYKPGTNNTAAIETPLASVVVPGGGGFTALTTQVIRASVKGTFDALAISFFSGGQIDRTVQCTIRMRTSDREQ